MPKAEKNFVDESLKEIYGDERKADFASLEYKKTGKFKKYLIGIVIALALALAASWGYFIYFGKSQSFAGGGVTLEFSGPNEVTTGKKSEYTLKYKNGEDLSLGEAIIEVKIPRNFSLESANPAAGPDGAWRIGAIAPGAGGEIKFKGEVWANLGDSSVWQAILNYRPENFNADFEKVVTFPSVVKESFLGISVEGPDKVVPGQGVEYKINFQNKGDEDIDAIEIHGAYPEGFVFKDAVVSPTQGNNIWSVGKLKARMQSSITLHGSFGGESSGRLEVKFDIGVKRQNEYLKQGEGSMLSEVAVSGLLFGLQLNGSADVKYADFGDTLNYLLAYKNQGTDILENIEIKFNVLSPTIYQNQIPILMETLSANPAGVMNNGAIAWDKKKITKLGKMMPGEEGTIAISVKLRGAPFDTIDIKDYKITATVSAKIGKAGNLATGLNIENQPLDVSILTDAKFAARVAYFENGAEVGSGPLPPKSGQTTAYRVYWEVTNSLHEISAIEASAVLLEGVNFTGRYNVEAGEISFDAGSRRVVWKLNRLPLSVPKVGINFEVSVTPKPGDFGKILPLTDKNMLTAKDTFNGGFITRSLPALNTGLAGDDLAAGKGAVIK